jgi:hypothetical protein
MNMTGDEPLPLKAGGEAAPELVRALYALGRRSPGPARLASIAQTLGAGRAATSPKRFRGLRTLSRMKARLMALAVGLAALL